jgi:hypothetical protein
MRSGGARLKKTGKALDWSTKHKTSQSNMALDPEIIATKPGHPPPTFHSQKTSVCKTVFPVKNIVDNKTVSCG